MLRRAAAIALAASFVLPASAPAATIGSDVARLARGSGSAAIHVSDVGTRRTLYDRRSTTARPLASLTKLYTADAALELLPRGVRTTCWRSSRPSPTGSCAATSS